MRKLLAMLFVADSIYFNGEISTFDSTYGTRERNSGNEKQANTIVVRPSFTWSFWIFFNITLSKRQGWEWIYHIISLSVNDDQALKK